MHRLLSLISIIFLASFFSCVYADSASDTLTQLLNNIHTMQANFTETVKDTKGKTLNQLEGKMSLQRPGQFRWDVTAPNRQLIVTNGKKIWIYDTDLQQVTIRYFGKDAGEAPALLLSHSNETLTKDFQVNTQNNSSTFLLKPKDKSSMFESIQLAFANQEIKEMQLQDHLGHITVIQFNRIVMNNQLPPSLFDFKKPANVDVIDETRQ